MSELDLSQPDIDQPDIDQKTPEGKQPPPKTRDRTKEMKTQATFGRCKINGISVIVCISCGHGEPVKTAKHRKSFRDRHAACHQSLNEPKK